MSADVTAAAARSEDVLSEGAGRGYIYSLVAADDTNRTGTAPRRQRELSLDVLPLVAPAAPSAFVFRPQGVATCHDIIKSRPADDDAHTAHERSASV